ncbi:MAG: long-chain fatty acid--CoA ligase [Pseudomonadota bacterium]
MQLTRSLLRAQHTFGARACLIFGDRRWTWDEHVSRIARLAGALQGLGVKAGDRVAILSHSSDRYIEVAYAILWSGAVLVPLSTRATDAELADTLADSDAAVLFLGDGFAPTLPTLLPASRDLAHVIYAGEAPCPPGLLDYEGLIADRAPAPRAERGGSDLAAIFYTGGTTGRAKGVMLSHANLYANAVHALAQYRYDERTVYLHAGPLYHLAAGSRIFTTAIAGATHVVIPRFSVDDVISAIETHKVTMTALVPTMMSMLAEHPRFATADLSSLDLITYGASPMPEALIADLLRRLPHVRFGQAYGMTELSPACTYLEPRHHSLAPQLRHLLRSAGRPALGVDVRIVDPQDRDVPNGTVGEIIVAGPVVMLGYWKLPELTAQALRGGYMHTGDLGYRDRDGFVFVVDRLKDMIVSGGENVYSAEVEDAIRKHPAVAMCAVIGVPHPRWGEAVHAVVVPGAGASVSQDDIIAHCRTLISGYKVPRSVEFRAAMPLSAANKILKTELRKPFWEGTANHGQTRNVG